jgi:hypothetical protein
MISDDQIALLIAERVRDKATDEVPVLSGDLKKSLQVEKIGGGKAAISSVLPYARAVHDGRRALTIYPNVARNPPLGKRKHSDKRRARLKFKVGGKTVFARKVHQKARKPNPFLRRAAKKMSDEGYDFLDNILLKQVSKEVLQGIKKNIKIG